MGETIHIGIIGDFDPNLRTHTATNAAFRKLAQQLSAPLEVRWLATPSLLELSDSEQLAECAGLFAAAGTPYRSTQGALNAIEFARTRDKPFLGTCGGFHGAIADSISGADRQAVGVLQRDCRNI